MGPGGAPGNAHDGTPGVHVPIGGAKACESRYDKNAPCIRHALRQSVALRRTGDEPQFVPQPLDGAAGVEDATLQGIGGGSSQAPGHRRHQPRARAHRGLPHVHQGKTTGAIGVFGLARGEAGLSEQRRRLVAGAAADGDARKILQPRDPRSYPAVLPAVGYRLRQQRHGDLQRPTQLCVPLEGVDIEEHRAGGVGVVRHMGSTTGEVPDEPGVYRSGTQLSPLRPLPQPRHMIQHPADLGSGEIGVDQQSRPLRHRLPQAVGLQPVADARRAAALPDDGVVHRFAGAAVPEDRGLPLVGDAYGGDLLGVDVGTVHHLRQGPALRGPDLHGIVLHPAGLGVDLPEGILGSGDDFSGAVEQDGAGAGGTLVQGDDKTFHMPSSGIFRQTVLF